ncbi:hypothetical protein [Chlorobaculum sp. 24CR]|uniref:hypothetical protein n=1 Tax=Chlorobaculum sp. 24CR TaxID=2508878 RepID=UPI001430D297|nr:hypothetical protein [Chlorobaculum sp. 24CR]
MATRATIRPITQSNKKKGIPRLAVTPQGWGETLVAGVTAKLGMPCACGAQPV